MTSLVTAAEFLPKSPPYFAEFPIDWVLHIGGFFREQIEKNLRDFIAAKRVEPPVVRLTVVMQEDPVVQYELQSWFEQSGVSVGSFDRSQVAWSKTKPSLDEVAREAERLELARELDSALVHDFLRDMQSADVDLREPPWIFWSRLPGWLVHRGKRKDLSPDRIFEIESHLAFVRSALSPQDEASETSRLGEDQVMVNPTFEIVDRRREGLKPNESPLMALARQADKVVHRDLTVLEAAVLDEARESFRPTRLQLCSKVATEARVHKEFVDAAIEELILDGFLLGKIADHGTLQ